MKFDKNRSEKQIADFLRDRSTQNNQEQIAGVKICRCCGQPTNTSNDAEKYFLQKGVNEQ